MFNGFVKQLFQDFVSHAWLYVFLYKNIVRADSFSIFFFENHKTLNIIDGEIYNIQELSTRFNIPEEIRKDANQIINYLYEVKGENFVNLLNGMFTIVLIDFQKKKLFVFKDKLGLKPLFYYFNNEKFLFHQSLNQ